ncbi:MAG TPA: hypothetical protein VLX12_11385 [Syntrophorhabdales bacterium]|nr:hypothetical protein [Syntrophorhabdales bacterium]
MKRSVAMACVLLLVAFFMASVVTAQEMGKMQTATGEVTSVDPQGTAITISWNVGKETLDVGTIVDKDTMVKVNGKAATLQDIKVGDTVTIRYLKSDNLYAKEITKK